MSNNPGAFQILRLFDSLASVRAGGHAAAVVRIWVSWVVGGHGYDAAGRAAKEDERSASSSLDQGVGGVAPHVTPRLTWHEPTPVFLGRTEPRKSRMGSRVSDREWMNRPTSCG